MRLSTIFSCAVALAVTQPAIANVSEHCNQSPSIRNYFYVGGGYAPDGSGGHIFRDQMYVERIRPISGVKHSTPLVLIHGQAQTGTNFLNKPDGGRGWLSRFISQGYEVYLVDQTFRGRSAWDGGYGATLPSAYSAERIEQRFTATQRYNLWAQAGQHTQWPGNGSMGDPVFDAFYSSNVQFIANVTYQQEAMRSAGAALLDRIGKPVFLMGHSQGGILPMVITDSKPEFVKALVLLEPQGPPFRDAVFSTDPARPWGVADIPLAYSPAISDPKTGLHLQVSPPRDSNSSECVLQAENPAPKQLPHLAAKPILVVTSQSSYHIQYDYCTVKYLRQAGCSAVEHFELADQGILGNGHMFFMEKNSDEIQAVVAKWMARL